MVVVHYSTTSITSSIVPNVPQNVSIINVNDNSLIVEWRVS